jgi:hypothetical protein
VLELDALAMAARTSGGGDQEGGAASRNERRRRPGTSGGGGQEQRKNQGEQRERTARVRDLSDLGIFEDRVIQIHLITLGGSLQKKTSGRKPALTVCLRGCTRRRFFARRG